MMGMMGPSKAESQSTTLSSPLQGLGSPKSPPLPSTSACWKTCLWHSGALRKNTTPHLAYKACGILAARSHPQPTALEGIFFTTGATWEAIWVQILAPLHMDGETQVVFHGMNGPQFLSSFICCWTFGLFPVWSCYV
ncbi:unnamed protein product [Rangifer tarandus platyrhynchus]|uniref:Uncharacterized protein n=2 Tax=Rangifer tarandus platyrhynchus TaxID=3082113 RepID=A0ABN8ZBV8_RANTA|nr:unnamed protein product [Rangifer tarandus platyrhynchus]